MKQILFFQSRIIISIALAALLTTFTLVADGQTSDLNRATNILAGLKTKYAPDPHLTVYSAALEPDGNDLILTGDVDSAIAKADTVATLKNAHVKFTDELRILPAEELGDRTWGIASLSVASGREGPEHKAEMGTQMLMGRVFHVLKPGTNGLWYYVQSADGYLSWLEKGTFVRCTRATADAWTHASLLFVTVFEDTVRETAQPDSLPVSDVVIADLLKKIGEEGDCWKVELPDGRTGFLPKKSAQNYVDWQKERHPTAENIETTAKRFLGRPYLWGANSPKGLDCSGFTKLVFLLNGIDLQRNASQQAREGIEVLIDKDLSQLKKGDLIFFGGHRRSSGSPHVSHVGIYLGGKLFIQSSERVQISSLDPDSPVSDPHRIRTLIAARRFLPDATPGRK